MNPFVAWKTRPVKNGAVVMDLQGVDRVFAMDKGESFEKVFPATASFRFDPDYKRDTLLVDFVGNVDRMLLCSQRAMEFIRAQAPQAVEYLPVTVLDHKGKPVAAPYFIVHPIDPPDCIDVQRSQLTWSQIDKSTIQFADHLEIDASKVPGDRLLFRPKAYTGLLAMRREFAEAIQQQGFSGAGWKEIK